MTPSFSPHPRRNGSKAAADAPRPGGKNIGASVNQAGHDEEPPILPGPKPVLELLESSPERVDAVFLRKGRHGRDMSRIVDLCRAAGVRFSFLEAQPFLRIYNGNSQGVVARLFETGYFEWDNMLERIMDAPLPLLVVLDRVQDPGNAGTLARTLYALGGAGLVTTRHNGVYLGAAAAKASAGAIEKLPVCKVASLGQAIDQAKKQGLAIYGASGDTGQDNEQNAAAPPESINVLAIPEPTLRLPAVLVLGSEETGLRPGLVKRCDFLLHIPMLRDFDSLNVAQAGGIIVSCFVRSRLQRP